MPHSCAKKRCLGCAVALFGVMLFVVVTTWTIRDSVPWVIPTRVVLDASERADVVTLLVDAHVGTTNKALHIVRPRAGTCFVEGQCGSDGRGQCTLLVAAIQKITYQDDSQMRLVATVEQAWSSNIRAALEHDGHGMVVSCKLSIDVNIFTLGYVVTKEVQWHSKDATKFLQPDKEQTNIAKPRFQVKQTHTHKDEPAVQSKTLSNFSVAKHFIAELTLPLGFLVTALESTSVGVNAYVGYREAEMHAMEGHLVVNSNLQMARNASAGKAVLSLPFHLLLRADLPVLAKSTFQSFVRPGTLNEHGGMRQSTVQRTMLLEASPGSRAAASILGDMHSIVWSSKRNETLKRNQLAPATFDAKMPPGPRRLISMFGIEDILGIELQNLHTSHRIRIGDNDIVHVELRLTEGPPLGASVAFNLSSITDTSVEASASLEHDNDQETLKAKLGLQMGDSLAANLEATYLGQKELASVNVDISGEDLNATATISGDFDDLIFSLDANVEDILVAKFAGREDVVNLNVSLLGDNPTTILMDYGRTDTSQDKEEFTVSMDINEVFNEREHNSSRIQASAKSKMSMKFSLDHGRRRTTADGGLRKGLGRMEMTPTCQATGSNELSGDSAMCITKGETKSCCEDGIQEFMVGLLDVTMGTTFSTEGLAVEVANLKGTSDDMDMSAYLDKTDKTMPLAEGKFRKANGRNALICTAKENSSSILVVGNTTWKELNAGYTGTLAIDGSEQLGQSGQIMETEVWFDGQWDGDIDVRFHANSDKNTEVVRGIGDWNRKSGWGGDLNATVSINIDDNMEKIMALADISEANDVRSVNANVKHNEKPLLMALLHVSDGGDTRPCFFNGTVHDNPDEKNLVLLASAYGQITNPDYALDTLDNRQITLTHPIQGNFRLDIRDEGRVATATANIVKEDTSGGNSVKATLQLEIPDPIDIELTLATQDGVQMKVTAAVKVSGTTEVSASGTLKEEGDWRQGDIAITPADGDPQILWARGSKGFLTQDEKASGYDALWFNFGTDIGTDVRLRLNLTDLYFERGPDIAWSGFGLKCQVSDMPNNSWQELYHGMLDVDFVPGKPVVKSGNFAATNMALTLNNVNPKTMKISDVIKSIAQASDVPEKDVVVTETKFQITSKYAFDQSVTLPQAKTTIATANNVQESQVNVTVVARRRLSAGLLTIDVPPNYLWRRLATQELQSVITTTDAAVAADVQTSSADTTKLTQALQQVAPAAAAPSIVEPPVVKVELKTQVLSNSMTPVAVPSESAITQSLQNNLGQQVQASVTDLGASSCANGVCADAGVFSYPTFRENHCAAVVPSAAVLPLLLTLVVLAGSL